MEVDKENEDVCMSVCNFYLRQIHKEKNKN